MLALDIKGRTLGLGWRGPASILHDTGDGAGGDTAEAPSVRSVSLIKVL